MAAWYQASMLPGRVRMRSFGPFLGEATCTRGSAESSMLFVRLAVAVERDQTP